MIPASSAVYSPAVVASIANVEVWSTEEEVVAARVTCVDSEMPVTAVPVERTIEVGGIAESAILPVEQDIAQVEITLSPVYAIQVIVSIDAHQIVEVHLIGCLVLIIGQIQLVSHLVSQEECLLACLFVTHC